MEKTYKSKLHGYNIHVKAGNDIVNVLFERNFIGVGSLIGCTYVTEDKVLQSAIEAHADFGSTFWTDDVEKEEAPVQEIAKEEESMEKKGRKLIKQ
jgi:hypothetical protein